MSKRDLLKLPDDLEGNLHCTFRHSKIQWLRFEGHLICCLGDVMRLAATCPLCLATNTIKTEEVADNDIHFCFECAKSFLVTRPGRQPLAFKPRHVAADRPRKKRKPG